ncbi:unnamed protein product [Mesocestoides corti]|uniref:C2HC/C3H-type domain-containing protein n=1 Tax=Mesocestoides corti TaxID=53468 RepID=A0A158QSW2_MESCO|nr:unnamed protein product [Mesocestoides corti]
MRSNCPKEKKNAAAPGPFIQGHVTGYYVKVKTFADMLALGAERRMRWRMRHEEFLHSVRTAKVNYLKERGEIVPDVKPLSPTITQAGMLRRNDLLLPGVHFRLIQCEFCERKFNEAALLKHRDQCREKQAAAQSEKTEEQKEAKLRFLKRMRYNHKFKLQPASATSAEEADNKSPQEDVNQDSATPTPTPTPTPTDAGTPTADHDEDILQKLATDLCLGANSCTGLPPDLLESSALNKFIQQNLHSLLALAPIQVSNCNRADGTESSASCREESEDANQPSSPSAMSSSRSSISAFLANSLPLISTSSLDSTSAAPSAVIVTEQQAKPKHKRHQQKPHHNFLPLSASSEAPATAKTSSPSSQCRRAKALNPPPTVVNNFVNETVIEEAPRRHQNKKDHGHDKRHKHSTDQVGELAVGVTSQTPRRSDGHHHRSHHSKRHESQNPVDGDHDSPVVFYKFLPNDAGSEKERRHSHKRHHLHLKIPNSNEPESSTVKTSRDGCESSLSSGTAVQESRSIDRHVSSRSNSTNSNSPRESEPAETSRLGYLQYLHSFELDNQIKFFWLNTSLMSGARLLGPRKTVLAGSLEFTFRSHHKSSRHRHSLHESTATPKSRCVRSSQSHRSKGCAAADEGHKDPSTRFCHSCGKKFARNDRFCAFCGAMRKSEVAPTKPTPDDTAAMRPGTSN